jgi:hypothetical protein
MTPDAVPQGLLLALMALLGVVVGVSITEIFASRREIEAERRLTARDRRDRMRAASLDALDQTHKQLTAWLHDALGSLAGGGASRPGRYSGDAYPKADFKLVGDGQAMVTFLDAMDVLLARPPGAGARMSDGDLVAAADNAITMAIRRQEARAHADEPLREMTAEETAAVGARLTMVVQTAVASAQAENAVAQDP